MLPLVVAAGLLIAIGNLAGGNPSVISDYKASYTIWQAAVSLGVFGMQLLPAVMGAAIAYSIADRPGIAPGLLMGMIANAMGAGFLRWYARRLSCRLLCKLFKEKLKST